MKNIERARCILGAGDNSERRSSRLALYAGAVNCYGRRADDPKHWYDLYWTDSGSIEAKAKAFAPLPCNSSAAGRPFFSDWLR